MTQISTSPVPKKHIVMSHIHLEETQNRLLLSQKITSFSPKICLVMTISQHLLSQIVTSFCPIFHLVMICNIDFSCLKSHLVLSYNLSYYDLISYSPVPKSHPVCPIIHHVMIQYQLLLSPFFCSIIHLVMTWYQLLLSYLVRSCFIIFKIMFSSNYWCQYHLIMYVNITFQGVIISHSRYGIVTFHSTLNSLPSNLTISYPHMSQYHLPTIDWFDIAADVIFPLLLF